MSAALLAAAVALFVAQMFVSQPRRVHDGAAGRLRGGARLVDGRARRPPRARRPRPRARHAGRRGRGPARRAHGRRGRRRDRGSWPPTSTPWWRGSTTRSACGATLFAAVSHDLRTPVTALRCSPRRSRTTSVDGELRREYVVRMGTHVRALGDADRRSVRADAAAERRARVDDGAGAASAAARGGGRRDAARRRRPGAVSVSARLGPPLGAARANPEQLQRVLFNLIQNAIRHTPADGSVTVSAETVNGGIEVEVADTGDGVPADSATASSSPSSAATRPATTPAPGSGWPSRARSSRRTAAGSGSRTRRSAPGCASRC